MFAAVSSSWADEYRLGVQDRLQIRVVEWQMVEGTFREWGAVSGEYTVGADGMILVPFMGALPATGKTTAEIADLVSSKLRQQFGLTERPETSVEIAEYRPFFVAGDVGAPGQYPYLPGLSVLKAISVAGGLRRSPVGSRAERDLINSKGSRDVLADQILRLQVRRARLQAEAEGHPTLEAPAELDDSEVGRAVVAEESSILEARQKKLSLQLNALDDLKDLLRKEIESLEQKTVTQNRQIELAREELSSIGSLADKGLVVNTRVLSTERTIADMEGRILDLETAILRARQEISKADQQAITIRNTLNAEIATERQQVEAELMNARLKLDMHDRLIEEAVEQVGADAMALLHEGPEASFAIVRTVKGSTTEVVASENTPVEPGDVIKVKLEMLPRAEYPGQ